MIDINELQVLDNHTIEDTSDKRIKISTEFETSFNDPDFKVLGFIGDKMFIYTDKYISKYTSTGGLLCRYYIEVSHGTFNDNVPYFYVFKENNLYKFSENLDYMWGIELDDIIAHINVDSSGNVIVLYENSRIITKYNPNGERLLYLYYEEDPIKPCKLHKTYISKGGTWLYIAGSITEGQNRKDFITLYNTVDGKHLWSQTYKTCPGTIQSETCTVNRLHVVDDRIFIEGYDFIMAVNPKMLPIWEYHLGYNSKTQTFNRLAHVEYDNSSFYRYIYFCEDLYETNGFSIGKLDVYGNLLWKYVCPEQVIHPMFSIAVDDDYIYTWGRESIDMFSERILSLNNHNFVFITNENKLIKIIEYNKEIYDSSFYEGYPLASDTPLRENPKYVNKPLYYKTTGLTSYVTDEKGNNILLTEENSFTLSDEDYIFHHLIADIENLAINDKTYLINEHRLPILTVEGNMIYTSTPYNTPMTYDPISDLLGKVITDMEGEEITVANGRPFVYYGLYADYFKMYAHLVTKKLRRAIVTKKDHRMINKKQAIIFKYKFRKLRDINLIVEYLVQNNILQTMYPNYIEQFRKHSTQALQTANANGAPCYFDLRTAKVEEFTFDTDKIRVDRNYESIFLVKNMPFNKKKEYEPLDIRSMVDMVKDETVTPFLLFVNGRCIKWTDITIVRDWHDTYLIIDNMSDENVYSNVVDCILFPCTIRYGEDNAIDPDTDKGLYFTEEGLYTTNPDKVAIRMEVIDEDVICETNYSRPDDNIFTFDIDRHRQASERNIFVFEEGLFYGDNRYYIDDTGYNVFKYTHNAEAVLRTFLHIKSLESKDFVFNVPNEAELRKELINMEALTKDERHFFSNNKFRIEFEKNEKYDRNVARAVDFILNYDATILARIMDYSELIWSYTYNDLVPIEEGGWAIFDPNSTYGSRTRLLPFVNGKIIEDPKSLKSKFVGGWAKFEVPTFNIDTDTIEAVTFRKCNDTTGFVSFKNGEMAVLDANIVMNSPDFDLIEVKEGNANNRGDELKFSYEHKFEESGRYKGTIITVEGKPIGTELVCWTSSSRRYVHHRYVPEIKDGYITVNTKDVFGNCYRYNELVFVNGELCISWSSEDKVITLHGYSPAEVSYVDVFYLPYSHEVYNVPVSEGITITLPKEFAVFPFDESDYWVFVDGRKVPVEHIECVDRKSFILKGMQYHNGSHDIKVIRFDVLDGIDKELFETLDMEDTWSEYVNSIKTEDIFKRLFG